MIQPSTTSLTSLTQTLPSQPLALLPKSLSLTIRPATLDDRGAVWVLVERFKHTCCTDFGTLSLTDVIAWIADGEVVVVHRGDKLMAAMWFGDIHGDVHGTIHFMMYPQFAREAKKLNLYNRLIQYVFDNWPVVKIKGKCMPSQKTAIKLLKALGFKQNALFRNETRVNGKLVDEFGWELHRPYWNRRMERLNGK
jgi:hypothetical protein